MELDICCRCKRQQDECRCICKICQTKFYDNRPVMINGQSVKLLPKNICKMCILCHRCQNPMVSGFGMTATDSDGKMVFACSNSDCVQNLKSLPWYIEKKKTLELKSEDLESGYDSSRVVSNLIRQISSPDVFGMSKDENPVLKRQVINVLLEIIIFVINGTRFGTVFLNDEFQNLLRPTVNKINTEHEKLVAHRLKKHRLRVAKYPDEERTRISTMSPSRIEIGDRLRGSHFLQIVKEYERLNYVDSLIGRMANKWLNELDNTEKDAISYYPMNASIWHLGLLIMKDRPLDGMQPILIGLLKNWFSMGFYPPSSKNFLDIKHSSIRKQLTTYLQVIGWNGKLQGESSKFSSHATNDKQNDVDVRKEEKCYNGDQTECVICLLEFDVLVRLQPCGHRLFCENCSRLISKCSVCMIDVVSRSLVPRSSIIDIESSKPEDGKGKEELN